jgi:hypothetical protein
MTAKYLVACVSQEEPLIMKYLVWGATIPVLLYVLLYLIYV